MQAALIPKLEETLLPGLHARNGGPPARIAPIAAHLSWTLGKSFSLEGFHLLGSRMAKPSPA